MHDLALVKQIIVSGKNSMKEANMAGELWVNKPTHIRLSNVRTKRRPLPNGGPELGSLPAVRITDPGGTLFRLAAKQKLGIASPAAV